MCTLCDIEVNHSLDFFPFLSLSLPFAPFLVIPLFCLSHSMCTPYRTTNRSVCSQEVYVPWPALTHMHTQIASILTTNSVSMGMPHRENIHARKISEVSKEFGNREQKVAEDREGGPVCYCIQTTCWREIHSHFHVRVGRRR